MKTVYDFTVQDMQGQKVSLQDYAGKVLLIVNTATGCGFTPQYKDLERIYETYREQGLEILDFPCDQFGHQAPGSNEEIAHFCTVKFGTAFPQFSKIEVNGDGADPLFLYLQAQRPFTGFDRINPMTLVLEQMLRKADPDYKSKPDIKWNFTKFLVDRAGNVLERFEPTASLKLVEKQIKAALEAK